MCNEIDFNVIFLVIHLQWTVVNTDGAFIVMILLLWIKMVLLCCDLIVFADWIDREYTNTLENNYFILMKLPTDCKLPIKSLMD
jgi:hypothetical protein